jgi:hypothetical protein
VAKVFVCATVIMVRTGLLKMMTRLQPADKAWLVIVGGAIVFELASSDLLSESSLRFVHAHPVLGRVAILGVAGHLGGMIPWRLDMFDARNVFHHGIVLGYRRVRHR